MGGFVYNAAMKNVIENRAIPLHLYYQYRDSEALESFFDVLHKLINVEYFEFMKTIVDEQSIEKSRTEYLAFWSLNMLGLYKPLGAASLNVFYDIEERYDDSPPLTYDDAQEYDGTIGLPEFKRFLSFLLDYSEPVININTLVQFAARWCKFNDLSQVSIEPTLDGLTICVPTTQQSGEFLKLLRAYYNELGLPYGVNVDIRYKEDSANLGLGI